MAARFGVDPFVNQNEKCLSNCVVTFVSSGLVLGCMTVLLIGTIFGCIEGRAEWEDARCFVVSVYTPVQGCKHYCLAFDVEVSMPARNETHHLVYTRDYGDFQDWDRAKKEYLPGKGYRCFFDQKNYQIDWNSDVTKSQCRTWILVASIFGGATIIIGILIPITMMILGPMYIRNN